MTTTKNIALVKIGGLTSHPNVKHPPLGLLTLATSLKKATLNPILFHEHNNTNPNELVEKISSHNPLAICFSLTAGEQMSIVSKCSNILSKHYKILIGGPMVSAMPELCYRDMNADIAYSGYAENDIKELILGNHRGIVRNYFAYDNSEMQLPDFNIEGLNIKDYIIEGTTSRTLLGYITSRGCPYSCSFCYNKKMHSNKVRFFEIDNVISHIQEIKDKHNINSILFHDDNMSASISRTYKILEGIKPIVPRVMKMRVDGLNEERVRRLADFGVKTIFLGIESGADTTLNRMQKCFSAKDSEYTISTLSRYGIKVKASYILGTPNETIDECKKTISFAYKMNETYNAKALLNFYQPWPDCEFSRKVFELQPNLSPKNLSEWDWFTSGNYKLVAKWLDYRLSMFEVKKLMLLFALKDRVKNKLLSSVIRWRILNFFNLSGRLIRAIENLLLKPISKLRRLFTLYCKKKVW